MFFTKRNRRSRHLDLSPDEVFMDASNLPKYDEQQFEGHLEKPIARSAFWGLTIFCSLVFLIFLGRIFWLSVVQGDYYAERSQNNVLNFTPIFAERGNIYDRTGKELVWTDNATSTDKKMSPRRVYTTLPGFGHILGYVSFPNEKEFKTGLYHPQEMLGRDGVERAYNDYLLGERGTRIVEVNAKGEEISDHIVKRPVPGRELKLSIDSQVQTKLFEFIKQLSIDRGFVGGTGVIMDVKTGELLALTSYPDYDPNVLALGKDSKTISNYFNSKTNIMLNRSVGGLYTPGSVFKPFMALGALNEKLVNPNKSFFTTGELVVPNPYDKTQKSVFKDWRDNGTVDMRKAIQFSSNVYFYIIGGGFGSQPGLGITRIKKYAELFGLAQKTGIDLPGEADGTLPSPEWKAKNFDNEPWRLGDTYHTAIGQYGVWVTPLQMVRAYVAIANRGKLIQPTIRQIDPSGAVVQATLPIANTDFSVIHEGMRQCAIDGTAKALNLPNVTVAAKTGTAELGVSKEQVNSWVAGFWPYENPRYAFIVTMEKGSRSNLVGGVFVMRQLLDWMGVYAPEYLKSSV